MVITNIEQCKQSHNRCSIYCDGEFVCALFHDLIRENNLRIGMSVTREEMDKISIQDERLKCYSSACRFLSVRSRSEKEMRNKLYQKRYSTEAIGWTIDKLKERDYIDDDGFAMEYAEYLLKKGYGAFSIKQKLFEKGISASVAEEAISRLPKASAVEAAEEYGQRAYIRVCREDDLYKRRNKFYAAMSRHGFGYDIAREIYARLSQGEE